jgi:hypothetical protein
LLDDSFYPKTKDHLGRLAEQYGQHTQQQACIAYLNEACILDFPAETETIYYTYPTYMYNHADLPYPLIYQNAFVPAFGE